MKEQRQGITKLQESNAYLGRSLLIHQKLARRKLLDDVRELFLGRPLRDEDKRNWNECGLLVSSKASHREI